MKLFLYISALIAIIIGAIYFMRWFVGFISQKVKNAWIGTICTLIVGGVLLLLVMICLFAVSMSFGPVKPD